MENKNNNDDFQIQITFTNNDDSPSKNGGYTEYDTLLRTATTGSAIEAVEKPSGQLDVPTSPNNYVNLTSTPKKQLGFSGLLQNVKDKRKDDIRTLHDKHQSVPDFVAWRKNISGEHPQIANDDLHSPIRRIDLNRTTAHSPNLDSLVEKEFGEIANDPTVREKQIYTNPKHMRKNRYPDVLPTEETRVILKKKEVMDSFNLTPQDERKEDEKKINNNENTTINNNNNNINNNNNNNNNNNINNINVQGTEESPVDDEFDEFYEEYWSEESSESEEEDYINANYIHANPDNKTGSQKYICCQAPLPNTFNDFWLMVWQEMVPVIVMLTKLKEKNRTKADMYWPAQVGKTSQYGNILVTWLKERTRTSCPGIIIREFEIFLVNNRGFKQGPKQVTHLQYTEWPDFGVPENTGAMRVLITELDIRKGALFEPIVVHCSAGIGRTGTLLAIHIPLQQIHSSSSLKVDVKNTVIALRQQRRGMVQTKEQYKFVYRTLKDIIKQDYSSKENKALYKKENSGSSAERKISGNLLSRTLPPKGSKKRVELLGDED